MKVRGTAFGLKTESRTSRLQAPRCWCHSLSGIVSAMATTSLSKYLF